MKIGVLGGTFNPVHIGHLVLAQECLFRFKLGKVIFVPAHIPPHKGVEGDVSAVDRLEMVRRAVKDEPRFEVSAYEIDKKGTSYSIETIEHFKDMYGKDVELYFIAGSDWAETLSTWKEIDRILKLTTFVVAARPGWGIKSPYRDKITVIDIPGIGVSSSMVRERVGKREPIAYLVPAEVAEYIREKKLYS